MLFSGNWRTVILGYRLDMRMIPSAPTSDTKSAAEKRVFEKLRLLPGFEDWTCLHSLRLSKSDYNTCGEIDFLLIGPAGVFVCEVKGGGVSYNGKSWTHRNRYGQENSNNRGPMKQAEQAMFSLKSNLEDPPVPLSARDLLFGWFVLFPDIDFDVRSEEWNGAEILDQKKILNLEVFANSILEMISYWKTTTESHARRKKVMSEEEISALTEHCRPMFDRSPSMRNMVSTAVDSSNALTVAQYDVITKIEKNRRLVCEGGAGTGKSFIALEIARRRRDAGMSVLFTAKNPNLLTFLRGQQDTDDIFFIEYDKAVQERRQWDFVVVDEAQDVITTNNHFGIADLVTGGNDQGQWLVCVDSATQTGFYGEFDEKQFDVILNGSFNIFLSENCRNTGNIVTQMGIVLNKDMESTRLADGPPVLWTPPLLDVRSEAHALEGFLGEILLQQGFEQQDVTILELNSKYSPLNLLPKPLLRNIQKIDVENLKSWPFRGIGVSSVRDFKGLESNVVCLVGAREIKSIEEARNMLYVAMSRARALLWIANTPEFDVAVKEIAKHQS